MERLIDPVIADLQHEHDEAIRCGMVWRGRVICLVGYCACWKVLTIAAVRQAVFERTAEDDRAVGRAVALSLVAVIALTALLLWPPLNTYRRLGTGTTPRLALYLLPQALTMALPLGPVFGITLGLRDRVSTARVTWTIVALSVGCCVATLILVGWLIPAANQAFRELAAGRRVWRGFNELTLDELASGDPIGLFGWIWGGVTTRRIAWKFPRRMAFAAGARLILARRRSRTAASLRNGHHEPDRAHSLPGYYVSGMGPRGDVLHDWLPPAATDWMSNLTFPLIARFGSTALSPPSRGVHAMNRPGTHLRAFAARLFDQATMNG
jgi:hypothetical protein